MKPAVLIDLGRHDYRQVWELQKQLVEQRQRDAIEDTIVFVEHPDVITLGRRLHSQANVLMPGDIPVVEVERGGDVTYHGPGQLVGYPILKLDDGERDLHGYLRALEEAMIGVCADFGVQAGRNPGWTGAWIGPRKVASLGIAVRKWVTLHGFALNVSTDLTRFTTINPCGLEASVMTSLAAETGRAVTLDDVKPSAMRQLGAALRRDVRLADAATTAQLAAK